MAKGGFGESMCIQVRREGTLLGSRVASVSACREDALFEGILSGRIPNDGTLPVFSVVPIFSEEPNPPEASGDAGARNITGVELGLEADPPRRYCREVFAAQARGLINSLVKDGKLDASAKVE